MFGISDTLIVQHEHCAIMHIIAAIVCTTALFQFLGPLSNKNCGWFGPPGFGLSAASGFRAYGSGFSVQGLGPLLFGRAGLMMVVSLACCFVLDC